MASLPSFVELMASLGIQDHATSPPSQTVLVADSWSAPSTGDSLSTGYTSASSPPIVSPPFLSPADMTTSSKSHKRDRSASFGRNLHPRFSPYAPEQRDLYARRGSFPGTGSDMNDLITEHSDAQRATSLSPTPQLDAPQDAVVNQEKMDIERVNEDEPATVLPACAQSSRRARPSRSQQHLRLQSASWGRRSGRLLVEQGEEKDMDVAVASISSLLRGSPTVSRFHPNGGASAPGSAPATKTSFTFAPYSSSTLVSPAPIPQRVVPNKGNYTSTAMLLASDDTARSFSQRRRRRSGSRNTNEPPPPLMIPTLPSIPALAPRSAAGVGGGGSYVSRRESHSPRSGGGWRSRRSSPPSAAVDAMRL